MSASASSPASPPPVLPAPPAAPAPAHLTAGRKRDLLLQRHRVQTLIGKRHQRTRAALPSGGFTPEHAKFWTALSFSEFVPELGAALRKDPALPLNRSAWTKHFADGFDIQELDEDALISAEDAIIASGSAFGVRLQELRLEYEDWPFMVGNLDCAAWLRNLCSDPDPAAANVYFTVTRGFTLLPPHVAATFPRQHMEAYGSALDNAAAVDAELERLLQRNFIDKWDVIAAELGLPPGSSPTMILPIGVVLKKGKTRIIIDGSAGNPSVNETQEPPDTVLPNMLMAMAAMTNNGFAWCSDYTDAFCQTVVPVEGLFYPHLEEATGGLQSHWHAFELKLSKHAVECGQRLRTERIYRSSRSQS